MRPPPAVVVALLLGLSGAAHAQPTWDPVVPAAAGEEPTVLPIWNNASGRIEALLLLDTTSQPRSPLERVIRAGPDAQGPGLGLRVQSQRGTRLDIGAGIQARPGMALLCDGAGSLLTSFGALGEHCLLASLEGSDDPLGAYAPVLSGGIGIEHGDFRFDIGANATRIDGQTPLMLSPRAGGAPGWLPRNSSLFPIELYGANRFESEGLGARGAYGFGDDGWVSLGGAVSRARLIPAHEALRGPLDWVGSELSVGVGVGNFSGEITGRNVDLPGSAPSWSGLDIGVSWRTPWQGKLTIGTQNVLSRGRTPWSVEPDGADEGQRTPYVRYQQDL